MLGSELGSTDYLKGVGEMAMAGAFAIAMIYLQFTGVEVALWASIAVYVCALINAANGLWLLWDYVSNANNLNRAASAALAACILAPAFGGIIGVLFVKAIQSWGPALLGGQ